MLLSADPLPSPPLPAALKLEADTSLLRLMTLAECATALGISLHAVKHLVSTGVLEASTGSGGLKVCAALTSTPRIGSTRVPVK